MKLHDWAAWSALPRWLQMLHTEKDRAGNPSYKAIAEAAGLNKQTVADIFANNKHQPRQTTLTKIMEALAVDQTQMQEIRLELYRGEEEPHSEFEPLEFRTDAQIIADAITNLADAVRSLQPCNHPDHRQPASPEGSPPG